MAARSAVAGDEIRTIHSMTHMIYHRNKNQHGSAKWWKWLRILKSSIFNLLMASEDDVTGNTLAVHEDHLRRRLIPRCYLAFSAVVADTQFSALGTVLLAILARVAGVVGFREENLLASPVVDHESNKSLYSTALDQPQDVGEPVHRPTDAASAVTRQQAEDEQSAAKTRRSKNQNAGDYPAAPPSSSKSKQNEPSTRRKRKKNAIDDLFSNLI